MTDATWERVQRVLCVRLDTLGDVLMTTPAIRALKESYAHPHVTLLTSSAGAGIAALVPEIDDVMIYDAPWLKATPPRAHAGPDFTMIERVRDGRFDAAVIFTVYSQSPLPSAVFCYLAGIPLRLAHCHENPYQLLNPWVSDPEPGMRVRHEVQRQLDLVAAVGCETSDEHLSLCVPVGTTARVQRWLETAGVDASRPWLLVHPGATAPSRRYPPELFARAVQSLALEHEQQIVFTGSSRERPLVERIRDAMHAPSVSLAGALSLPELAAVIACAPLLIANNTGPVHMAAALGTPVVDLYALTNPQHTPWQVRSRVLTHDVPCKYCYKSICPHGHHDCLRGIPPEMVVQAACALLHDATPERAALEAAS
ncbi:MAG TPA: lipopolysaccharide heptosyltransferase II [Gemmatimonadaceae bacterium]|jgi:lipopolysaccharide heptosyltransferase II|nr:lipopolysaccharide heptosyltransferase II [Gemmatimonadaceae bacterium]